jgi:hypothetical protein
VAPFLPFRSAEANPKVEVHLRVKVVVELLVVVNQVHQLGHSNVGPLKIVVTVVHELSGRVV